MKCIIYFQKCEDITNFSNTLKELNKYYAYDYKIEQLTYLDSKKNRKYKLKELEESTGNYFMCSVNILNECIDVPSVDTIYITYNCVSKISCIQRMSRAMRISKSNYNKIANVLLYCNEFSDVLTFISAIKEVDDDFKEKIRFLECSNKIYKNSKIQEINTELNIQYKKQIIGIVEYRGFNWNNILDKVKKYIDAYNKPPSTHDKNNEIKQLGNWISNQQNNYTKKQQNMKTPEIYTKWEQFTDEYHKYFMTDIEVFDESLDKVKKYIDAYNKRPSAHDKNKEIKQLGGWIGTQQKNYTKKQKNMKTQEICTKWEQFTDEYQKYFKKKTLV